MGICDNFIMDSRPTPRSMVPLTPYEQWQMERYGNFISESEPVSIDPGKTWIENQIEIFEFNQIDNA